MSQIIEISDEEQTELCLQEISGLDDDVLLVFLGHGYTDRLFSRFVDTGNFSVFVEVNGMNVFKGKNILALACESTTLFNKSYSRSKIENSIGFGVLPTEMVELEDKKIRDLGATEDDLGLFRNVLVDCISKSLINYQKNNKDVESLFNYLKLLLSKEIYNSVKVHNNRRLSDLIFLMRSEMSHLRSLA